MIQLMTGERFESFLQGDYTWRDVTGARFCSRKAAYASLSSLPVSR
jgi:hypothetical protein